MRKLIAHASTDNEIDMTPMLDIVFIMLIFFIVTSSFVRESGLGFGRPSASEGSGPVAPVALLELTEDNRIISQQRELDPRVVSALLEQRLSADPATRVLIQAHEQSSTAVLLQLVDAAKRAGIEQISVGNYSSR